jgi:hypothetical protein
MKAIQTRYYGPTNTLGARIKAIADGVKAVTISYPHEYNAEEAHRVAAQKLADKYGWNNALVGGALPNGDYAFCMVPK